MEPIDALTCLQRGNQRFVEYSDRGATDTASSTPTPTLTHEPIAAILACSDARIPTELVFDQGVGDLFVIRVAGNVATPTQIGSIEFAVAELGVELVVVLGHSRCGAVTMAYESTHNAKPAGTPALEQLLSAIQPAVDQQPASETQDPIQAAIWRNVQRQVELLTADSELLAESAARSGLQIVGACYDTAAGRVEFDTDV